MESSVYIWLWWNFNFFSMFTDDNMVNTGVYITLCEEKVDKSDEETDILSQLFYFFLPPLCHILSTAKINLILRTYLCYSLTITHIDDQVFSAIITLESAIDRANINC